MNVFNLQKAAPVLPFKYSVEVLSFNIFHLKWSYEVCNGWQLKIVTLPGTSKSNSQFFKLHSYKNLVLT